MNIKINEIPAFDHCSFLSRIRINTVTDCWVWVGNINLGYGRFYANKNLRLAHRCSYDLFKGPIFKNLLIDHICMNKSCVNPEHLRMVTIKINTTENSSSVSAINKNKTHCINGHEFNEENTRYTKFKNRTCRKCANKWSIKLRRIANLRRNMKNAKSK